MHKPQQHEILFEKKFPSGAEEWFCPTCGRRLLIGLSPFKVIVLEIGDEYVYHSGSKGSLRIRPIQIPEVASHTDLDEESEISEERLHPWLEALENIQFDDWWDDKAT